MTHTPTPWKVFRTKNGVYLGVGDAEGYGVMDAGFGLWESGAIRDANAEFVVTAVNSYAKHRALIEEIFEAVSDHPENSALGSAVRQIVAFAKREGFL